MYNSLRKYKIYIYNSICTTLYMCMVKVRGFFIRGHFLHNNAVLIVVIIPLMKYKLTITVFLRNNNIHDRIRVRC